MRIKRGTTKHKKHLKIHKLTKGYRMSYNRLYKRAKDAVLHAGSYSYAHRKKRGEEFRKLWTIRINAALEKFDLSYSKFIHLLKLSKIELDRKILADLAEKEPEVFEAVVLKAKEAIKA
jgi:large subunit ribosomal protein L20